jgi:hypothetical protein
VTDADPDTARLLANWQLEADDARGRLRPVAERIFAALPGSSVALVVDFDPAEVLAAISEGLTPIDVARVHVEVTCDPGGAVWLAEILERGQEPR